jgi:5-methylcytosine-specific restriction endonuclease McrBC GTP-binding regulatory subunit McrB
VTVVSNGCLALCEEHRLSVFQKSVLWRIFRYEREEVAREKRKHHSEELHDLYTSQNVVRMINSRWQYEREIKHE